MQFPVKAGNKRTAHSFPNTANQITSCDTTNCDFLVSGAGKRHSKGYQAAMAKNSDSSAPGHSQTAGETSAQAKASPEWADGLRKLYDSVVEEPLPDSFMDLLSKLDEPQDGDQA